MDGLWKLAKRHETFGGVRGTSFFITLYLVEDHEHKTPATELTLRVVNDLRSRGIRPADHRHVADRIIGTGR